VTLVAGLVGLVALLLLVLRVRALMRAGRETEPAPAEDPWAEGQAPVPVAGADRPPGWSDRGHDIPNPPAAQRP
jgi:hypothetical protein